MVRATYEAIKFKKTDPMVIKKLMTDGKVNPDKVNRFAENIVQSLKDGTYKCDVPLHKRLYCKNQSRKEGKWREIYCPSLKDHVLHHALIIVCMKAFTRGMDDHCCGSVPKRGTLAVKKYVERWVRRDDCKYFVKLDIRHFFDSIQADRMIKCLQHHIKDKYVLNLFEQIIYSAPVACPVGYYTSPWFANLYLEEFDHMVKEDLCKERRGKRIPYVTHMARYADDILLMGNCKRDLEKAVHRIVEWCEENGLKIKDTWEIKRIAILDNHVIRKGTYRIDICGYTFDKEHTRLRAGIFLSTMRLARKMKKKRRKHHGKMELHDCQSLMSKIGWAVHADSEGMIQNIDRLITINDARRAISNAAKRRTLNKT